MTGTITSLSTRALKILGILVVEDQTAVSLLNPRTRCAFLVVVHNAFDRILPLAHLLTIRHLQPFRGSEVLDEATILCNEANIGDALEKGIEFFWLAG
jgi:hypothetical protein